MSEELTPPIPGKAEIDLAALVASVIADELSEQKAEHSRKIKHIIQGINEAKLRQKKAEEVVEKEAGSIQRGLEKLKKIQAGDWSVLQSIDTGRKETEVTQKVE